MNSTLNERDINTGISQKSIIQAVEKLNANNMVNTSYVSRDYYFSGLIEISSIKHDSCELLFFNNVTGKIYCENKNFDLSFLPELLLKNAKKSPYKYAHVLICKKLTLTSKSTGLKTILVIPLGHGSLGHYSDFKYITPDGIRALTKLRNDKSGFWENIPTPRYKEMSTREKLNQKGKTILKKLFPFSSFYRQAV